MSATLAEPERFVRILEDLTGRESALVRTTERPVPLDFTYTEKPLTETIGEGQLVELLADFPEVHGAIRHRSFTYKNLSREASNLNRYISRVIAIRKEREGFRAK